MLCPGLVPVLPMTKLNLGGLTGMDLVVWPDALPVARNPLGMTTYNLAQFHGCAKELALMEAGNSVLKSSPFHRLARNFGFVLAYSM